MRVWWSMAPWSVSRRSSWRPLQAGSSSLSCCAQMQRCRRPRSGCDPEPVLTVPLRGADTPIERLLREVANFVSGSSPACRCARKQTPTGMSADDDSHWQQSAKRSRAPSPPNYPQNGRAAAARLTVRDEVRGTYSGSSVDALRLAICARLKFHQRDWCGGSGPRQTAVPSVAP